LEPGPSLGRTKLIARNSHHAQRELSGQSASGARRALPGPDLGWSPWAPPARPATSSRCKTFRRAGRRTWLNGWCENGRAVDPAGATVSGHGRGRRDGRSGPLRYVAPLGLQLARQRLGQSNPRWHRRRASWNLALWMLRDQPRGPGTAGGRLVPQRGRAARRPPGAQGRAGRLEGRPPGDETRVGRLGPQSRPSRGWIAFLSQALVASLSYLSDDGYPAQACRSGMTGGWHGLSGSCPRPAAEWAVYARPQSRALSLVDSAKSTPPLRRVGSRAGGPIRGGRRSGRQASGRSCRRAPGGNANATGARPGAAARKGDPAKHQKCCCRHGAGTAHRLAWIAAPR